MVTRLESLIDAIGSWTGCPHDPESYAYKIRNPLLLKSFAKIGKHELDGEGRRIFTSFLNGYKGALFDLELKISGKSRAHISPQNGLQELLACYDIKEPAAVKSIVSFIKRALQDQNVTAHTPISYFLEDLKDTNARPTESD